MAMMRFVGRAGALRLRVRAASSLAGRALVRGRGAGALLHANVPLSFWGGISPETGRVIDVSHPLLGECVTSRVLAIPNGRGSCTGSQVVLELLLNGTAPAAILLRECDEIISLGAIVAEELFGVPPLPVVSLGADGFERIALGGKRVCVVDGVVQLFETFKNDQHYYLVLEDLSGGDLFDRIEQNGPFKEEEGGKGGGGAGPDARR